MKKFLLIIGLLISANMIFAQSTATLRVGSTDASGLTPGDKVYVPLIVDDISAGSLIIGFDLFVAFDHTVLSWDGTNPDPLPGVQSIHPNMPYTPSDWLFNDNGEEIIALWYDPDYSGELVNPGESFFTYVFTYLGGETDLTWGVDVDASSGFDPGKGLEKGNTAMWDQNFLDFNLTLVDGSVSVPGFDATFHVTAGGIDLEGAMVTVGAETMPTDASGMAMFNLPNGDFDYTVTNAGYYDEDGSFTIDNAPENIDVVMIEEGTAFEVTFHVTSGGSDLEGAMVEVGSEMATTDAMGMAVVNLPNGDYNYTVSKYGYSDEMGSITVASVAQTVDVDMTMLPMYDATFHVTSGGSDVEGASIEVVGIETLMTDANGEAVFSLVDGVYDYVIMKDGYIEVSGMATVAGAAVTVDVEMTAIYAVTLHVSSGGMNLISALVIIDGEEVYTDGEGNAVFMLIDGDYDYDVTYPGYFDEMGSFTVDGAMMTVEVEMISESSDITFHVTADGMDLEGALVSVEGNEVYTGADGLAIFTLQDGDYIYSVSKEGYVTIDDFLTVSGANQTIEISMEILTSNITFHVASGGANVNEATVTVGTMTLETNFNGIAMFELPDGDYDYTVTKLGYEDAMGSFTVEEAPQTIEVELIAILYDVTFHVATGGSDLEGAEVTIDGNTMTTGTNGNAMFTLPNGTYAYTVVNLGYDDESGSITVSNGPLTEEVEMMLTEWQITIHVTSGGVNVSGADVTIDGNTVVTGGTGNAVFDLVNGDYDVEVMIDGYETYNGSITVENGDETFEVDLIQILYETTMHVTSGGADLEDADVTIDGNTVATGADGNAIFDLPNGTYTYNVTKDGYMPEAGSFTVASATQTVEVEMMEETYEVTFNVTASGGAVSGASVTIDGETLVTPANGTVVFELSNGDYDYEVTHPVYITQNGTVTVAGGAVIEPVVLTTGVGDLSETAFNLYPNPSTGQFYISASAFAQYESTVTVYDFTGKVVSRTTFERNEINMIDLTGQEDGMYMLQIIIEDKVFNKTVVIQ